MSDPIVWAEILEPFDIATAPPRSSGELRNAEAQLGSTLPTDLRILLAFSDGLFVAVGQWYFVWPLDRLVSDNLALRADASGFPSDLLAFGDDGTGAPFCMSMPDDQEVCSWSPIDGEAKWLNDTLEAFVLGWLTGTITT